MSHTHLNQIMQPSDKTDADLAMEVASKIDDLLHDQKLSCGEALAACSIAIALVVQQIDCPDCRRMYANQVKKGVPAHLRVGLDIAARRDSADGCRGAGWPPAGHVHSDNGLEFAPVTAALRQKLDYGKSDNLSREIEGLIGQRSRSDVALTDGERLTALMIAMATMVKSIRCCRGCRELAAEEVKKRLSAALESALTQADERDAGMPPLGEHVH